MPLLQERLFLRQYDTYIMDIPAILDLCKQDVIPIVARDELYQVLSTGYHKSVPPLTGGATQDRLRVGDETNAWSQAHSSS